MCVRENEVNLCPVMFFISKKVTIFSHLLISGLRSFLRS